MSTILQINKFYYPRGGSETYLFSLSAELQKRGHTVVPFAMTDEKNIDSPYSSFFAPHVNFDDKKTVRAAKEFVRSQAAAQSLERLLQEIRPDIAHVHNFAHQLTPSILRVLKAHHIPIVYTAHDYQLICPSYNLYTEDSPCQRCHVFQYWNAVVHRCVRNSVTASALSAIEMSVNRGSGIYALFDRIIAPSQFLREMFIAWKYPKEQVVYIPHGVEVPSVRNRHEQTHFLYVGRLIPEKGVDVLIRALAHSEHILHIIGEGPQEEELRQLASALNVNKRIHFLGKRSAAEVEKAMQEARAVIVPSRWYENAPLVVYEALRLGVPVIGARIGGIPELIDEGRQGYTFESGNPEDLRATLDRIVRFPIDNMPIFQHTMGLHITRIEALYAEVYALSRS